MEQRTRGLGVAATDPRELTLADAPSIVLSQLTDHRDHTDLTVATVEGLWQNFVTRGQRMGVGTVDEVDRNLVVGFVQARNPDGSRPSVATMHLRRWAVRFLFRLLREVGVRVTDPTLDVELPPRTKASIRPLLDEEVALCRLLAVYPAGATLKPAAWSLAESTATTSEIPAVRRSDVETSRGVVRLPGSRLVEPRWAELDEWAFIQIDRRLHDLDEDPGALVAYIGDGKRPQAAAAMVIGKVLRRAGLAGEPGVRPASIRAWAGMRVFQETGSIEEVARRLGLRSLDAAARLIGMGWRGD